MLDASLFPPSAKFCWMRTAVPRQGAPTDLTRYLSLHPLEQALVTHSVDKRKAEFGDARWCAHQALEALGRDSSKPILRGERGMPLWPSSVSGSLTHTDGFRAAVAAPRLLVHSMGLDAEPAEPLPDGVLGSIARDSLISCDPAGWTVPIGYSSAPRKPPTRHGSHSRIVGWGSIRRK